MKIFKNVKFIILSIFVCLHFNLKAQDTIKTKIFNVVYSEILEQPTYLSYRVECPTGSASRSGLSFKKFPGVKTSDDFDYANNDYDKGHIAPAAAFNCTVESVKLTFSYLNCALQHSGLNRGPWKELERFERNLAKIYDNVEVEVLINFSSKPDTVKGGASIPESFTKTIKFNNQQIKFKFPNQDVSGTDWITFMIK